jgi:mRNA interferase RelE/StbE
MDIILSKDSKKFIEKLAAKQAKQIVIKIKELEFTSHPNDSKQLKGVQTECYRVDLGEFRIIYEIKEENILILLVGKRNDNEVYNRFKRKIK